MNIHDIARVAHQVNKGYCEAIGDMSQKDWEEAPDWQKQSAISGVVYVLANPDGTPEQAHEEWLRVKREDGWKYGPTKDLDKKEHPCMLPYDALGEQQKVKDFLFRAAVLALGPK